MSGWSEIDVEEEVAAPLWRVVFGLVLGLFAALLLVVSVLFLLSPIDQSRQLLLGGVLLFAGLAASNLAWRLASSERRSQDGGLLSPAFLRVSGALLVLGGLALVISDPREVRLGTYVGALGVGAFVLAHRRAVAARRDRPLG